jgi:hypothetical protein
MHIYQYKFAAVHALVCQEIFNKAYILARRDVEILKNSDNANCLRNGLPFPH